MFIPALLAYYFLSDSLTVKDFFIFYSSSFLSSIIFINNSNYKTSIVDKLRSIPLNFVICLLFLFSISFFGDFKGTIPTSYFFLFIINIFVFIVIYKIFKLNLFLSFFKINNLNYKDYNIKYYNPEILLAHKFFFNKNKKNRKIFSHFKFIKNISIFIGFSSLFYYSYLIYKSHFDLIFIIGTPFLSLLSYFFAKKILLVIYFLITPLRLIFNNLYNAPFSYDFDCNGIAVFEEDNIKVIQSSYKELFKPILIYKGQEITISDNLWKSFIKSKNNHFLSYLKEEDFFKKIEKLKKINDF